MELNPKFCLISIFAMVGVLMRQGFDVAAQPLESINGIPLYKSYFSNFIGCFFIGFFGQIAKEMLPKIITDEIEKKNSVIVFA